MITIPCRAAYQTPKRSNSQRSLLRRPSVRFGALSPKQSQRLQAARQSLTLTQEIARLDRFDLLILDDLSYVRKDQAETSVLFELISARYERRSIMITANQPFSGWDSIFLDKAMTVAAIDRLVHHATILEMNVESYRCRSAIQRQSRARRQPTFMKIKFKEMSRRDNQACE